MKKIISAIMVLVVLGISVPVQTFAGDPETTTAAIPKDAEARSAQLLSRLEEIKSMDIKSLSRTEKRQLRHEVKDIRKEMRAQNGVYLSVGAIIIIILLLILIL